MPTGYPFESENPKEDNPEGWATRFLEWLIAPRATLTLGRS